MRHPLRPLESARSAATGLQNHVVDEFLAGRLDRRALLREGARFGLAAPLMAGLLGRTGPARAQGAPGAVVRVATALPPGAIDPVTVSSPGGALLLSQTGEFLAVDGPDSVLRPGLAMSWSANDDGTVWSFRLRPDVRFHDGHVLTAADVVATMDRLADPKNGSNALSVFRGVLSPGGARAVDGLTVAFHLDGPNGNFPYFVSSDNYNAVILPAGYAGGFERDFNGTGPFRLERYTPKQGMSLVRNEDYWGRRALPARLEFTFYADQQPQVLALQGGQVDVVTQVAVQGAQGLLNDPEVRLLKVRAATHRAVHMRSDAGVFADKRVRQAVALSLDRPAIVAGLFRGLAVPGNDSPFAPVYPSTDTAVPQRAKDLAAARALLAAAGVANGFAATLTTERVQEMPDYAVVIQNAAAQLGIRLTLKIETDAAYYGRARAGESDWLDSEMGITDYGHRGVPNVLLGAPLVSGGAWNAARFGNAAYDGLVAQYAAALDLGTQRAVAGRIERLLLDETPVITAYFYDYLAATAANVTGVSVTAVPQVSFADAAIAG